MDRLLKANTFIIGLTILIPIFLIGSILINLQLNNIDPFSLQPYQLFILTLLLTLCIYVSYKKIGLKLIYLLILFFGLANAFLSPKFSPIDEGAHLDYILYLQDERKLPLISQQIDTESLSEISGHSLPTADRYEAVHPPLYYFVAAIFSLLFKWDIVIQFYSIRILGLLFLLLSVLFIIKTYKLLIENKVIKENNLLLFCVLSILSLSPGILTRMVTVSNESLVVFLITLISYYFIKHFLLGDVNTKNIVIIGILTAAVILTKFTSLYIVGVISLFLLYKKYYQKLLYYISISLLGILPWIIFNFLNYGSFTGTHLHVAFVKPIANPENTDLGVKFIFSQIINMISTFWQPQEAIGILNQYQQTVNHGLVILLLIVITLTIYSLIIKKNILLNLFFLLMVLFNFIIMSYGTISEDVNVLIGRYFYMNILSLVLMFYITINELLKDIYKKIFTLFSILVLTSLFLLNLNVHLSQNNQFEMVYFFNKQLSEQYIHLINPKNMEDVPSKLSNVVNVSTPENVIDLTRKTSITNNILIKEESYMIEGPDPHVIWSDEIKINAENYRYLFIEIDIDDTSKISGQVFFKNDLINFSEENSFKFNLNNGKNFVPLKSLLSWNSHIDALRLDFDGLLEGQSIKIKEIQLVP